MKKIIILALITVMPLWAVVPKLIPIQGVLTNSDGSLVNESVLLELSLYDKEADGELIWTEEHTDFPVKDGYISVYLGEKSDLDVEVLTQADQLWLEIVFNGEKIPRVKLGMVPFALEAIKAQQIGSITEQQLMKLFTSACSEGYYLKGYTATGDAICSEDLKGVPNGQITYSAGDGILINDQHQISVDPNLYTAGEGIKIENRIISIDKNKVASTLHRHDHDYYSKINISDNAQNKLVKLVKDVNDEYVLEETQVTEEEGVLNVENVVINDKINAKIGEFEALTVNTLGSNTTEIHATTIHTTNVNADTAIASTLKFGEQEIKGFTVYQTDTFSNDSCQNHAATQTDCYKEVISYNGNDLTKSNAFCTIGRLKAEGLNDTWESVQCHVRIGESQEKINNIIVEDKWILNISNNFGRVRCAANCLIWNWD